MVRSTPGNSGTSSSALAVSAPSEISHEKSEKNKVLIFLVIKMPSFFTLTQIICRQKDNYYYNRIHRHNLPPRSYNILPDFHRKNTYSKSWGCTPRCRHPMFHNFLGGRKNIVSCRNYS